MHSVCMNSFFQCRGAGAARSGIILVKPEPQRDTALALAPTVPAPKRMFNKGGLSKMSQTLTVSYFYHSISYQFKSKEIVSKNCPNPDVNFCLFKKSWLGIYMVTV
jgi:hypothetical protein